jgi:hypothetical protein
MRLARLFASWVDEADDFERVAPVPFSVVCFRAVPAALRGDEAALDDLNSRLVDRVNESGDVFLSHTRLNGRFVIRLAIGSRSTVGEAIGHAARRAPAYVAATLIWIRPFVLVGAVLIGMIARNPAEASPGVILALFLLACVMLFFAIRMLMTSAVASAESKGPMGIIRRSWQLTAGNFWRLLVFFILFIVTLMVAAIAIGSVAGIIAEVLLGGKEPMSLGALFIALVTQLVSAAVSVVLMVMLARIYVQLAGDGAAEASVPTSGS